VIRSEHDDWVWAFVLEDVDGRTRLLSRNRFALTEPSLGARIGVTTIKPGMLVMERKMLQGIKERAERLARDEQAASVGV
jgi:hypothetical protein